MKLASIRCSLTTCILIIGFVPQGQAQSPSQVALFGEVDKNHDGYIDLAENNAANEKRFKIFDKDNDGKFSRAEMIESNKKFGQSDQVARQTAQFYLGGMDKNGDDAASWQEFSSWMSKCMFAPFDTDHDSRLSKAEFALPPSPSAR